MSAYVLETIRAQPGQPFEASGRIVEVLNYNPTYGHLLAVVDIGEATLLSDSSDGDDAGEPECGKLTDAGTRCTRTVDQPEDRCWQHNDEDE